MTVSVIGHGTDAVVELTPESMIVLKRLRIQDPELAVSLARQEYDYLKRFSQVVARYPYLSCPHPVGSRPDRGVVAMSFCPGERLDLLLENPESGIDDHLDHIIEQIVLGLTHFLREFGEPYDLATNNIIYDIETRQLHMVDFILPANARNGQLDESPAHLSLGGFIGFSLYHTVRPSTWSNREFRVRQEYLLAGVLSRFNATSPLDLHALRSVSSHSYWYVANRGRATRRYWYATAGWTLFARRRRTAFRLWRERPDTADLDDALPEDREPAKQPVTVGAELSDGHTQKTVEGA